MNNEIKTELLASGMTLIGKEILDSFITSRPEVKKWINTWIGEVEGTLWTTPHDIKAKYGSASFLANNIVIFNVKGNKYRLEIKVAYKTSIVKVLWAGSHEEYDKRNRER